MEVYLRAVKLCPGNIFPTPYPQGYGATPPLPSPRTAHAAMEGACRRPPRMAMPVASYIQLVDALTGSGHPVRPAAATIRARRPNAPPGPPAGVVTPRHHAIAHRRSPESGRPPVASEAHGGFRRQRAYAGRMTGIRARNHRFSANFTSTPPPGVRAAQPACHQAGIDRAVRFDPTGTGHDRDAHFPVALTSETLRDRTLRATLPCRHSAGGGTCHVGTTGRSRFDHECRGLGTRARPRGNVQERQARRDQEDANTEGA